MRQPLVNRIVRLFEVLFFTTNITLTCLEIFLDFQGHVILFFVVKKKKCYYNFSVKKLLFDMS